VRRQLVASELELLQRQLRATNDEVERLALVEQQLATRIEVLTTRERVLEARQGAAAIRVRVGEALAGLSEEASVEGIPVGAESRANELEARAAALDELLDSGALGAFGVGPAPDHSERIWGSLLDRRRASRVRRGV
jgi:phage shock protein A